VVSHDPYAAALLLGLAQALLRVVPQPNLRRSKETTIPDIIFDRGDVGKEPMIRVLGRHPDEVVDKVLNLGASPQLACPGAHTNI
jgi:hypothetical protein